MTVRPAIARRAAVVLASLFAAMPAYAEKPVSVLEAPMATTVTAIAIDFDRDDPARRKFGKLIYRGGLNLFGKSRHFGGYSGILVDRSGRQLLAISDGGTWMRATLDYDGRKLKGLDDVTLGPILGANGKPLRLDADRDAESMTLAGGDLREGTALVGFERHHRIMRYPFGPKRFGPPGAAFALPAEAKRMGLNSGFEALAELNAGRLKGTLIVFSERLIDRNGNLKGWLIGGPTPGAIVVERIGGFDITDAAPLPDGGIVLLERRFRYSEGVKMRVRRIAASEIKPGATITGETLLEAQDNLNIDNMEAIAAHRSAAGETVITLMSDDNFSPLQRTLIMQFALPSAQSAAAN